MIKVKLVVPLRVATKYTCGILFSRVLDHFLTDYSCIASDVAYRDLTVETLGKRLSLP